MRHNNKQLVQSLHAIIEALRETPFDAIEDKAFCLHTLLYAFNGYNALEQKEIPGKALPVFPGDNTKEASGLETTALHRQLASFFRCYPTDRRAMNT